MEPGAEETLLKDKQKEIHKTIVSYDLQEDDDDLLRSMAVLEPSTSLGYLFSSCY